MDRIRVLQGVRAMRFDEVYGKYTKRSLTTGEAAQILGITERTFRRWRLRFEGEGQNGLWDKRVGRKANNAAPVDEVTKMLVLFETRYRNFSASHFYDKWREEYNGKRSYTWVKMQLQEAGLIQKTTKRGVHRKKRPRRPMVGMMLHQDGSTHEWIAGKVWDLIVTMDDATSEIYSAFFVDEEGTWSSFRGVQDVIEKYGLFCSFYTDRGSHYWHTPKAGDPVDKHTVTQFQRAMQKLGIDMIAAYSPEARGRSERAFRTLQDRLPKELNHAGIVDMETANRYLRDIYLPTHNKRFAVKASESGSAFVPWVNNNYNLADILCIQETRTVAKDNTVSYKNKQLQIQQDKNRYSYAKAVVKVHEYANGELAIFYGPRCLARYGSSGNCLSYMERKASAV